MGRFTTLTGAASIAIAGATAATAGPQENSSAFSKNLEQACNTALETLANMPTDLLESVNSSIEVLEDTASNDWTSDFGNTYKNIVSSDNLPIPLPDNIRSKILSTPTPTEGIRVHAEFLDGQQSVAKLTAVMTCDPLNWNFNLYI